MYNLIKVIDMLVRVEMGGNTMADENINVDYVAEVVEDEEAKASEETSSFKEIKDQTYTDEDIEKNKVMAGLAYLIFFLPLIVCPDSKYGRYHANQALLLFIVSVAGSIILSVIPIVGLFLLPIYSLGIFALFIIGLVNGFGGKAKPLPLIGGFTLIK